MAQGVGSTCPAPTPACSPHKTPENGGNHYCLRFTAGETEAQNSSARSPRSPKKPGADPWFNRLSHPAVPVPSSPGDLPKVTASSQTQKAKPAFLGSAPSPSPQGELESRGL